MLGETIYIFACSCCRIACGHTVVLAYPCAVIRLTSIGSLRSLAALSDTRGHRCGGAYTLLSGHSMFTSQSHDFVLGHGYPHPLYTARITLCWRIEFSGVLYDIVCDLAGAVCASYKPMRMNASSSHSRRMP